MYPVYEGGVSVDLRKRAEFLLQALSHFGKARSRTGFDNALEKPHLRREIESRYPAPEYDLEGHIRPGARYKRGPLMKDFEKAFRSAYGDRQESLRAVTADMTPQERAEFDIALPEVEEHSAAFRVAHEGKKNQAKRRLLRKQLNRQLETLPAEEQPLEKQHAA